MATTSVSDLKLATQNEFAFLTELGLLLVEHREFAPQSYRGGFELVFGGAGKRVAILYSDCEFEVRADGEELFGATTRFLRWKHVQSPTLASRAAKVAYRRRIATAVFCGGGHITNRWTGAAEACFASSVVRRRLR